VQNEAQILNPLQAQPWHLNLILLHSTSQHFCDLGGSYNGMCDFLSFKQHRGPTGPITKMDDLAAVRFRPDKGSSSVRNRLEIQMTVIKISNRSLIASSLSNYFKYLHGLSRGLLQVPPCCTSTRPDQEAGWQFIISCNGSHKKSKLIRKANVMIERNLE